MNRSEHRRQLRDFLDTIRRPDRPLDPVDDDVALVASGLIDSLAVLEIILYLESRVGLSLAATGVQPEELRSVTAILDLIERHGR